MKNSILVSIKLLFLMSVLLGGVYPLAVTLVAQTFFLEKANGSLIIENDHVIGSRLLAQKAESTKYFWSRPSASDHGALPSGASNQSATSKILKQAIEDRRQKGAAFDLLFASASGLDPHISVDAALHQADRIVQARQLSQDKATQLKNLIVSHIEKRDFLFLGEERINVLMLNLAMDRQFNK